MRTFTTRSAHQPKGGQRAYQAGNKGKSKRDARSMILAGIGANGRRDRRTDRDTFAKTRKEIPPQEERGRLEQGVARNRGDVDLVRPVPANAPVRLTGRRSPVPAREARDDLDKAWRVTGPRSLSHSGAVSDGFPSARFRTLRRY